MIAGPHGGGAPPPAATTATLGIFRAEDYGAHSTQAGAVDASGGILMAAAIAAAQGGGIVLLDSGLTYAVRRTVALPANVELMIPTGTVLQGAAGLVGDVVTATNAAGVRISGGGTIDANRAAGTTGNAVTLTNCLEPQVEELTILNAWQDGVALVNCTRAVLDVLVGACGRHGVYHSGSMFCRGQISARDNGQRVAGHGVVFDAASTDNGYGPIVATDSRVGGAKTQQYGVFEVPASGCDRNVFAPSALTGNAAGTVSLVGANSGTPLAPGSVTAAAIAAGAISDAQVNAGAAIASTKFAGYPWHNADLSTDVARANQFTNPGFEIAQRTVTPGSGNYLVDRWLQANIGTGNVASAARNTVTPDVNSGACLDVTLNGTDGTAANCVVIDQKLENVNGLRGSPVSFSIRVRAGIANSPLQVFWNDGVTGGGANQLGAPVLAGVAFGTVTLTFTPAAGANQLFVGVALEGNTTYSLDNATLVPGTVASAYVALPSADDFARCQRYYQRWQPGSNQYVAQGSAQTTTSHYILIPFKSHMGGAPTVTLSAAADWLVVNELVTTTAAPISFVLIGAHPDACLLGFTTAAALGTAGAPRFLDAGPNAWLALEWNP